MFRDKTEYELEARFDGETPENAAGAASASPEAAQYARALELMRQGAQEAARHQPIADEQFSHFMAGVRGGIEVEQPHRRGWMAWASLASLSAAALLIAFSFFWAVSPPQEPVSATVIESATTDIEGAVVDVYDSEYGVTTVWVNASKADVW